MVPAMTDESVWGDVQITYPGWKGTAQLDQSMTQRPIAELIGVEPNDWMAIGIEIGGGEGSHHLRVYAVSTAIVPGGGDVLPRIAEANGGEIPVTEFVVHDVDPYEFLRQITHDLEMRLRVSRIADSELPVRIVDRADAPPQG